MAKHSKSGVVQQSVTIFSNGATDFRIVHPVEGEKVISIPVRTDYIGDVLDSLSVSGPVSIFAPASYRPSNTDEGNLTISTDDVIDGLAKSLSGSEVTVNLFGTKPETVKGILMGLDLDVETFKDSTVETRFVVVISESGIQRFPIKDVKSFVFNNKTIQDEIDKALRRNFQQIKSNSTFVDITLSSEKAAQAIVQYTIPTAAWKMSYRLAKTDAGFNFQGLAIVDNNTDEKWENVNLTVVTGEPITFKTDLATSKVPARSTVSIVSDSAQGAVEIEEGMAQYGAAAIPVRGVKASLRVASAPAMQMMAVMDSTSGSYPPVERLSPAQTQEVEVKEVGDFSVFNSLTPVTIPANRSALIPVFSTDIKDSRTVLHFKPSNHAERAFRSIAFKNETDHSLSRGPCVIHEDSVFQGKCVIPSTKPGGECFLPHAIETGVKFQTKITPGQQEVARIKIAEGFFYSYNRATAKAAYTIKNQKDESFELIVDYSSHWADSEIRCSWSNGPTAEAIPVKIKEKLANGWRIEAKLQPKQQAVLYVTETTLLETKVVLGINNWNYLDQQIAANGSIVNDSIKSALSIKRRYDDVQNQLSDLTVKERNLEARQNRLRQNLTAVGSSSTGQAQQWQSDLANSETQLNTLQEVKKPNLTNELRTIQRELEVSLQNAHVEWAK